jgi:tetratricopeptide (TPR) repeat protein
VRRSFVGLCVLTIAIAAGATVYTSYASDREYSRLIDVGDRASVASQPFPALEAYTAAIALRPGSMLAYLKRGRIYKDQDELDSAARDLRRAAELDPTATLPLELLGDTYLAMNRYDRAADRFQAYLSLDDRSSAVWYKLGLAQYRSGYAARAVTAVERAVALDNTVAESHLLLGLGLRDIGQPGNARVSLERATRLAPGLMAPREALAGVYADLGDHARAIDQLEALAALDPTTPARFVALGRAHLRARRHEAAVLALSRAVERFPDEPQIYGTLGRVWLEAAEQREDTISLKKALEALTTASACADADSSVLTDLGHAWSMAGDLEAAERALRQALARTPVDPEAYLRLANIIGAQRALEARDLLVRYATLIGDERRLAPVATDIAVYSLRVSQPAVALKWIDKAVEEAGEPPALARLRAQALAALPR